MKPEFKLIHMHERYWNMTDMPELDKIVTSFLVDVNRKVHLCDIRASCELDWITFDQQYKDWDSVLEERREEIDDIIMNEVGECMSLYAEEIKVDKHDILRIDALDLDDLGIELSDYELDTDEGYSELQRDVYEQVKVNGLYW